MKTAFRLIVFLLITVPLAADNTQLNGTWEWNDAGYTMVLVLNPNGAGTFDGEPIRFSVSGDRLVVDEDGEEIPYRFKLEGDRLTLWEGDLDDTAVFRRKGSTEGEGIGSRKPDPHEAGDSETKMNAGIAGTWTFRGQKGTVTLDFRPDGTGSLDGSPFHWQFEQDILLLSMGDQSIQYNAALDGDVLTLSGGDLQTPAPFQRSKVVAEGTAGVSSTAAAPRNTASTSRVDCNAVALAANVTGGCRIRLVTPGQCEEIDLRGGQSYEFAWTTDGTDCETPYKILVAGNPPTEMNTKSWQFSTNVEQGITRKGGIVNATAADLAGLTSDNGLYHWVVIGYYGSHPNSSTFRVKQ